MADVSECAGCACQCMPYPNKRYRRALGDGSLGRPTKRFKVAEGHIGVALRDAQHDVPACPELLWRLPSQDLLPHVFIHGIVNVHHQFNVFNVRFVSLPLQRGVKHQRRWVFPMLVGIGSWDGARVPFAR